jgi:hypothetical protein
MKRRNNFLEQLKRRQEAATGEPEPTVLPPEEVPNDPAARAEYLSDELTNTREQLKKEKAAREQAERRLEAIETPAPKSMADLLRQLQAGRKRATWR